MEHQQPNNFVTIFMEIFHVKLISWQKNCIYSFISQNDARCEKEYQSILSSGHLPLPHVMGYALFAGELLLNIKVNCSVFWWKGIFPRNAGFSG